MTETLWLAVALLWSSPAVSPPWTVAPLPLMSVSSAWLSSCSCGPALYNVNCLLCQWTVYCTNATQCTLLTVPMTVYTANCTNDTQCTLLTVPNLHSVYCSLCQWYSTHCSLYQWCTLYTAYCAKDTQCTLLIVPMVRSVHCLLCQWYIMCILLILWMGLSVHCQFEPILLLTI